MIVLDEDAALLLLLLEEIGHNRLISFDSSALLLPAPLPCLAEPEPGEEESRLIAMRCNTNAVNKSSCRCSGQ